MILTFLGCARTGTYSLWSTLSKHHKNISCSRIKEPLNRLTYPRGYLNGFSIDDDTKVLLDGTPAAYRFHFNIVKRIKDVFKDIRIIYPVRNPHDRLYSYVKCIIIFFACTNHKGHPEFIEKLMGGRLEIRKDKVLDFLRDNLDSDHIEHALKITDKVLITRLDKINLDEILNFLEVEPIDIELLKIHTLDEWYTSAYDKCRNDINSVFFEQRKEIDKIVQDDLRKIRNIVDVEDWIV